MCKLEFRKDLIRKRFFHVNKYLLTEASKVINQLYGSNVERLDQLKMIEKTELFQKKYPGVIGKDIAEIIRQELITF